MTTAGTIDELWAADDLEPAALLRAAGATLDPMVTGPEAYQYERIATGLYDREYGPGRSSPQVNRWEAPGVAVLASDVGDDAFAIRFFAFAVLSTSLRRAASYRRLARLLDEMAPTLGSAPLFLHYRAMAEVAMSSAPATMLATAREAVSRLGEHAGAHHTLALAFLETAELEQGADRVRSIEEARRSVERAIRLDREHPRFRLTRARTTRLLGHLDDARWEILAAWHDDPVADLDPERRRLYEYELLLTNSSLELERRVSGIEKRVDERVAGVEVRAAQLAGFITGLVAITTVGAGLAANQASPGAAIAVLLAIAVLVFGGTALVGLLLARGR